MENPCSPPSDCVCLDAGSDYWAEAQGYHNDQAMIANGNYYQFEYWKYEYNCGGMGAVADDPDDPGFRVLPPPRHPLTDEEREMLRAEADKFHAEQIKRLVEFRKSQLGSTPPE